MIKVENLVTFYHNIAGKAYQKLNRATRENARGINLQLFYANVDII